MKIFELETTNPVSTTSTPSVTNTTTQPADPRIQTQLLYKQQQDKIQKRKEIQDQINALNKQITDLRKQLSTL